MEFDKFNYSLHVERAAEYFHDLVNIEREIMALRKQMKTLQKQAGAQNPDLEVVGLLNVQMAELQAQIEEKQGQYLDLMKKQDAAIADYAEADEVLKNFKSDKIN